MGSPSILIVAGDPSGDKHASYIVKNLKTLYPESDIWGIGGSNMQNAGFRAILPFEPFNKMGYIEVALHIVFFLRVKKILIEKMKKNKPDCLVCIDYPGFNMQLMKAASKLKIPVVWYIAPMVWAWKSKRAQVLAENTAHIACIFPFEVCYFKPYTNNVSFVGNPLVEAIKNNETTVKKSHRNVTKIAIVPGSRKQEILHLLDPMVGAFTILKKKYPDISAVISRCTFLPEELYSKYTDHKDITFFTGPLTELYAQSDCAIVTSGTATLEAALIGIPHVITYKTSILTYSIFKHFLKTPFIGLPNIISQELLIPECIQNNASPVSIANAIEPFLNDHLFYNTTVTKLMAIRNHLGAHHPSQEMVQIINNVIDNKKPV